MSVKESTRQRSKSVANERVLALAEAMRARKETEGKAATHCEELNRLVMAYKSAGHWSAKRFDAAD
eukprot:3778987-Heterocapsa_arctica.AAC.1